MPYEIKQDGQNYNVINSNTGEQKAKHLPPHAKEKAEKQVKLLHEMEDDKWWNSTDPNGSVESESGH